LTFCRDTAEVVSTDLNLFEVNLRKVKGHQVRGSMGINSSPPALEFSVTDKGATRTRVSHIDSGESQVRGSALAVVVPSEATDSAALAKCTGVRLACVDRRKVVSLGCDSFPVVVFSPARNLAGVPYCTGMIPAEADLGEGTLWWGPEVRLVGAPTNENPRVSNCTGVSLANGYTDELTGWGVCLTVVIFTPTHEVTGQEQSTAMLSVEIDGRELAVWDFGDLTDVVFSPATGVSCLIECTGGFFTC